jgi:glucose/arabinose dehydrogenase
MIAILMPAVLAPVLAQQSGERIRAVAVATGLVHPWSLAFLPDGSLLIAEQAGRIRIIRNGLLEPQPVWTVPGTGTDLLRAVAVHPKFAQNRLVYFSYPKAGIRGFTLAVARGRLAGATLTDVSEIFVADAWDLSSAVGLGGRIMFGPDATLYVAVGDRDLLYGSDDSSMRMRAQSLDNHIGKVLRIADDGTVPKDNPFVGKAGVKPEIFTYGHRNTYGFAFHPTTGELWQAEIGPMGGPSFRWAVTIRGVLFRISRGRGRGWRVPECFGSRRSVRRASFFIQAPGFQRGKEVFSWRRSTVCNCSGSRLTNPLRPNGASRC